MSEEYKTLVLSSNASVAMYKNNSIGNFKTHLHIPMMFDPTERWQVAVSEISFPKSYLNVMRDLEFGYEIKQETHIKTFLPAGHYATPKELIETINNRMDEIKPTDELRVTMPQLNLSQFTNKVCVVAGKKDRNTNIYAVFCQEIFELLGLVLPDKLGAKITNLRAPKVYSKYCVDLRAGFSNFYFYSDICAHNLVGDSYTKLLRVIPVDESAPYGSQLLVKFENPLFIDISKNNFDYIEVDLKTDFDKTVQFDFGRLGALLLFRRLNES